jgi:toxin ParE1/3/4
VYIADAGRPDTAEEFTESVLRHCESLRDHPQRGRHRPDIRPGLRTLGFRRTVTIAFEIDETAAQVFVLRVLYRGRDVGSAVRG